MRMIGNVDFDRLHPKVRQPFELLSLRLEDEWRAGNTPYWIRPFEGFRDPDKQIELLREKRTKAGPWQSAHNYGLAVDFVPFIDGEYRWPRADHECWDFLRALCVNRGLINSIDWDRPHVEHPIWHQVRAYLV